MTDLYGPMSNYLAVLMARTPNIEDWQLMEAARYAFKLTAKLVEWEFSKTSRTKGLADGTTVSFPPACVGSSADTNPRRCNHS